MKDETKSDLEPASAGPALPREIAPLAEVDTARQVLTAAQRAALWASVALLVAALVWRPLPVVQALLLALGALNLLFTLFKLLLVRTALGGTGALSVSPEEVAALDEGDLPMYTVLVPAYKEAAVLPGLVASLGALDYPPDRLEILLLLEQDDDETIAAARALDLPPCFRIVVVPPGQPRGKPRACNYGLAHCRGDYLVIYDAEDHPGAQQLKKALVAFAKSDPRTVCVQAKLNYHNHSQNLLTRLFTAEYSMWFDLFLPGLHAHKLPIPLGGTSNHFRVGPLLALGAWDAWNVTEDADLGLRLYKRGLRTVVLDSTTYEEATSGVRAWVHQRSRWIKGYVQTWLVHMRQPLRLWRELGPRGFLGFQLMYVGTFFTLLVNPLFWGLTVVWAAGGASRIDALFSGPSWALAALSLYAGNFALVYMLMVGCLLRGRGDLVKYGLLAPAYWVLMSLAAWKGTLQLVTRSFYWAKTTHGIVQRDQSQPLPITAIPARTTAAAPARRRRAAPLAAVAAPVTAGASGGLWLWAGAFLLLAAAGAFALHRGHLHGPAALEQLYETFALTRGRSFLSGFRMEMPPLPTLLLVPAVCSDTLMKLLLPGVLLGAAFGAGAVVLLDRMLDDFGVPRALRLAAIALYTLHPFVLAATLGGTGDALLLFFVLFALRCLQRLRFAPHGDRHGVALGLLSALLFLTRYEAAVWGPTLLVALAAALSGADRPRGALQGHLLLCGTSFVYAAGIWLFFGHLRHGTPWHFLSPLLHSERLTAATGDGPAHGSATPLLSAALWALPAALPVAALLLFRAARRRDGFALALLLCLVTPTLVWIPFLRLGARGSDSLLLGALPVLFVAAAYLLRTAASAPRWLLPALLAASSAVTYAGIHRPASRFAQQARYLDLFLGRPVPDDLPDERRVAAALDKLFSDQPDARVLASESAGGYAPLLLSGHPGAFLTERTPRFEDLLREPAGEVDYVLVTDADLAHDRIDWAYPDIAHRGAPFLQPVLRLPLRDGHGAWLYRVAPPSAPATPLATHPAPPPGDSRWIPDGVFVGVEGTDFVVRAPAAPQDTRGTVEPFRFVGGNFRALQGERERKLYRETLDAMAEDGLTVGRVWALGEGEPSSSEWQVNHELFRLAPDRFIEESYRHLDRVLAAARQRGIRLIITLANNWSDYGGVPAYLRWAGIPEAQQDGLIFLNDARVRRMYLDGVEKLLSRTNTVTGVRYVDDPTIFGWELINEGSSPSVADHVEWTRDVATYIKQRDPNHLITSGMVNCQSWRDWLQVNSLPQVDYMAVHVYPHETQCSWRCLETVLSAVAGASRTLQKPVILQEFGFPRGASWDGAAADVATYRMLTMAMRSGFRGALVWAYEPFSDRRQEQFGIIVDRPDPDDRRAALRRRAEELRAGHPAPEPQPDPDDQGQLLFAPLPPPEHDGWQASAGGALLEIRPDQYHVGTFRRRQGAKYLMTQLTHVYGKGAGRFGYHIGVPRRDAPPKALEIEARISEWEWENRKAPPPGWTSPVRVLLDDQEIARFDAIPDDRLGKVERIRVERPEILSSLTSGRHTLWFEVPDGPDAHGLCIYGPPAIDSGLAPADHPPIRIRLLDAVQD